MSEATTSHLEYLAMLAQIDSLFDDYDTNKHLIDRMAAVIEQYETTSPYFAEFNQSVTGFSSSSALLQVLMDQHGITASDVSEQLGGSEAVAAVLSGQQSLTSQQLLELSKRFGILPETVLQN